MAEQHGADTPVQTPLVGFTTIQAGLLLLHTPPVQQVVSVVVLPKQKLSPPEIGQTALTVTVWVDMHPEAEVYVIVTTPPATPVTTPVQLTVATAGSPLLHGHGGVGVHDVVNVIVPPAQTDE